jgi:hypothetical protein
MIATASFGLRDDQYLRSCISNLVETFSHLTEVRQTGDSVQVAEEYEHECSGIIGEANHLAVRPEECQVIYAITNLDSHYCHLQQT